MASMVFQTSSLQRRWLVVTGDHVATRNVLVTDAIGLVGLEVFDFITLSQSSSTICKLCAVGLQVSDVCREMGCELL